MQSTINIKKMEFNLKAQAKAFVARVQCAGFSDHNAESTLFQLTGTRFKKLSNQSEIDTARYAIEKALLCERKKARLKRQDYDLNRHIALHQARKRLESISPAQ